MHTHLSIDAVTIHPERLRRTFDPVAELELAKSIETLGLFHAILVRQSDLSIIAGERRLRAIKNHLLPFKKEFVYGGAVVPSGKVPAVLVPDNADPLFFEEIELAENTVRRDLDWRELADATAKLHALRTKRAEAAGLPAPHTADTAAAIHSEDNNAPKQQIVRQQILVAANLDKPEVARAPDLKSAFKALKQLEDAERNRVLAKAVGETYSASVHQAVKGDCLDKMLEWVEDEAGPRFDVILTDPPYGMGAHEFGDAGGKMTGIEHHYDDSYEAWQPLMREWAALAYNLAKPLAHAYVFCDIDRFHELKGLMAIAGWYVWRTPLTNFKRNSGRMPIPDLGPKRQSEWLLYAIKGKRPTLVVGAPDVIETTADENLTHGAQKPVALYEELLRRSANPGDMILDPFAGTGTIFPAAHRFKCTAYGIERSDEYFGLCVGRLKGLE